MLLDDADTVARKFKRAVTDSGSEIRFDDTRPAITNLLTIYHLMTGEPVDKIEARFSGKGYAELKRSLTDVTIDFLKPLQERIQQIGPAETEAILNRGRERAQAIAGATFRDVRNKVGLAGAQK